MIEFVILSMLTSLQILFVGPLLIGHLFRIQGYKITDQTECNTLVKKLNINRSSLVQNEKPYGFFYGKWFLGYICSRETESQKCVLIQVREKSDWNGMLDKVTDLGFYPHLILILTSNVCVEKINGRDVSLLRKGRIDKTYHMTG